MPGLGNFLLGEHGYNTQLPLRDEWGTQLQQWIGNQGQQTLGQNKPFDFAPIAQQAQEQFRTETVPSIADRFLGTSNTRNSSGFQNALGAAGAGLQQNLAALKAQYDYQSHNQQQQNALQMLGMGLQPSYENIYTQGSPGFLAGLGENITQGLGKGLGDAAGNLVKGATQKAVEKTGDAANNVATGVATGTGAGLAANAVAGGTPAATVPAATVPAAAAPVAAGTGTAAAGGTTALAQAAGPIGVLVAAAIWGITHNIEKKKLDKAWEWGKKLADAGQGPYPPDKKHIVKQYKELQKAYEYLGKGQSFEDFLKAGAGESYEGYLKKLRGQ